MISSFSPEQFQQFYEFSGGGGGGGGNNRKVPNQHIQTFKMWRVVGVRKCELLPCFHDLFLRLP